MPEEIKWAGGDGKTHRGILVDRVNSFDILDCEECGFKHATPIPTADDLVEVYSHDYYETEKPLYIEGYLEDKEWWDTVYTARYEILEGNLPSDRRKILDVGSGPGLFLSLGKARGWQVKGIEPSIEAARYSREILKLDIEEVFFDEISATDLGKFDVINMGEVLEHLPNPRAILNLAHSTLNEDGLICIIVPNDFNPFQELLRDSFDFKPWWIAPPHHINYFNRKSLISLVESCRFEVLHTETTFPIDMFLLMGDNYVGNDSLGREVHNKRKCFDIALSKNKKLRQLISERFSEIDIGREIVLIGRKTKREIN